MLLLQQLRIVVDLIWVKLLFVCALLMRVQRLFKGMFVSLLQLAIGPFNRTEASRFPESALSTHQNGAFGKLRRLARE
jgi:hypothetical protein